MNLLILEAVETGAPIPRNDRRYEHVKKVLKKAPGDRLAAGIAVDEPFAPAPGALGEAVVLSLGEKSLELGFEPFAGAAGDPEPLAPLRLILGFPRPIQANRIFKDLASLGAAEIHLVGTELGEKSYLESDFFKLREWRRPLLEGAEQAGNPRLPRVRTHWSLARCLEALADEGGAEEGGAEDGGAGGRAGPDWTAPGATAGGLEPRWRGGGLLALHPGPGAPALGSLAGLRAPLSLAIGSERGWTEAEVARLEDAGFARTALGARILKTETATLAATAIVLGKLGRM
ncbi:MAG: RsmE family RNA methyltransferase [Spirochaetaceae bacterium]|nr:RsmE family RNA methyltransferase [Spirochaetaceae bacterium]